MSMRRTHGGRSAGDVAAELGIGVQTLHYYEREKLIAAPPRTRAGHRLYSEELVDRVRFIRKAQSLGLSLEEIREIIALAEIGANPCGCVLNIFVEKLAEVDRRIAELHAFRRELAGLIEPDSRVSSSRPTGPNRVCAIVEAAPARSRTLAVHR